jgi:hypothetical protein
MKRLRVLLCALLLVGAGCASDSHAWDEFWKDLRGDNMKMRNDFSTTQDAGDRPTRLRD